MSAGDELVYVEGRHPVMERVLAEPFVANDLRLGDDARAPVRSSPAPTWAASPPSCARPRSSSLMAQMGCFVPAREAKVGLVDRIFTRVGATDHILRGQSTFMVEMQETAHILRHATRPQPGAPRRDRARHRHLRRPLHRLGGGRAPRARRRRGPKTLFATHYHELTDLAADLPGVGNLHVSAREWQDGVVFLRKIEPGGSDRSFGIQVARLAGLPAPVVVRAQEILRQPGAHRVRPRGPPAPGPLRRAGAGRRRPRQLAPLLRRRTRASSTTCGAPTWTTSPPSQALALLAELKQRLLDAC